VSNAAKEKLYRTNPESLIFRAKWAVKYALWQAKGEALLRREAPEGLTAHLRRAGAPAPVFIGATGGSGTRAIAAVLASARVHIGSRHNFALDAMDFVPFAVKWLPLYLRNCGEISERDRQHMGRAFAVSVLRHRKGIISPDVHWAAKAPRFIYLLPYLQQQLPDFRFIHMIRDGRDMAFAANQSQVNDYGRILLPPAAQSEPAAVRSIMLWSMVNTSAADFGRSVLGDRYMRVSFEDLCERPREIVPAILEFADASDGNLDAALAEIKSQPTQGRWRDQDKMLIRQLEAVAGSALAKFGYRT
jgi:hypothetical protein